MLLGLRLLRLKLLSRGVLHRLVGMSKELRCSG